MNRFLAFAVLTCLGTSASALKLDKQLATHCGALLLGGAHDRPSPRDEFLRGARSYLEKLDAPAATPSNETEDVQTLALEGWDQSERREQSARRLGKLVLDLDRWSEVTSVVFSTRGSAEIAKFIARLHGQTSKLDRETFRHAARENLNLPSLAFETASAAALLLTGWQAGQVFAPSLVSAYLETAGIVAAAYVAKEPARRLYDLLIPEGLLDVGRVKIDSHLRVIAAHDLSRAHIGLSTPVSTELIDELRRAKASEELNPAKLAGLLLSSARATEAGGQLLVDHITFTDDDGEQVLLSAVRVVKTKISEGARRRDFDWRPQPTTPRLQPALVRAR